MSIYVLRSDNLVKIGFTENLRGRVQAIVAMVPVPVEFVGHMPGGRDLEVHLHERFRTHRFSGEWFVETENMRTAFDLLLTAGLPEAPTVKGMKRAAEKEYASALANRIKDAAAARWPQLSIGERVSAFQADIGWNKGRAKDAFYSHPRMAIRAFELEELEAWLSATPSTTKTPA